MSYSFSSKLVNVQLLLGVALVVLIIIMSTTTPTALAEHHDHRHHQPSKVASDDDPRYPDPYPSAPLPPYGGHPPVLENPQHKPEP